MTETVSDAAGSRTRRSAAAVGAIGAIWLGGLLLGGLAVLLAVQGVLSVITSVDGVSFGTEVRRDGTWHEVTVKPGHTTTVWAGNFEAFDGCDVVDTTGRAIPTRETDHRDHRSAGGIGDWVTELTFVSPSSHVRMRCSATLVLVDSDSGRWWGVDLRVLLAALALALCLGGTITLGRLSR